MYYVTCEQYPKSTSKYGNLLGRWGCILVSVGMNLYKVLMEEDELRDHVGDVLQQQITNIGAN